MTRGHLHGHHSTVVQVSDPNPVPGRLGVTRHGSGLDVAVVARATTTVEFRVIELEGSETRYRLLPSNEGIWHGHIEGRGTGTRYGSRVHGPWDPDSGLFHNPTEPLLDPYTRGLEGTVDMVPAVYMHMVDEDLYPTHHLFKRSPLDSRSHVPYSVVVDNRFAVAPKPRVPWEKMILYEIHVKGFTRNMPGIPPELQGTYAGLAHPVCVAYLKELGITPIELPPVHAKYEEPFLSERGLTSYWGYSTLSFSAPEASYTTRAAQISGAQAAADEFRGMVSILRQAGIEVILDVVYNHTCEDGDGGPFLCWHGLDSDLYYRHTSAHPVQDVDDMGCGNTMNADKPRTIATVLDSLRHWTTSMDVDGFRFDLAATLGRFSTDFSPMHPLLVGMATDPEISTSKLIAEPWDIRLGGWQTGNFPAPFSEWNNHYRGVLHNFWLSDVQALVEGRRAPGPNNLTARLAGSRDMYDHGVGVDCGPRASINFVTTHDGFTLVDLTVYNAKHNWANLEGNQDGSDDNRSWNHGIEGPVTSRERATIADASSEAEDGRALTSRRRRRTQRNLLTTLLLSSGTPTLVGGDEFARTQNGNNNACCQDLSISWVDWKLTAKQIDQKERTKRLIALRLAHPVLRPSIFATGMPFPGDTIPDLSWYMTSGASIPSGGRSKEENRVFQMLRSGASWRDRDTPLIVNGTLEATKVTPLEGHGFDWLLTVDTTRPNLDEALPKGIKAAELNLDLEQVVSEEAFEVAPASVRLPMFDVSYSPRR